MPSIRTPALVALAALLASTSAIADPPPAHAAPAAHPAPAARPSAAALAAHTFYRFDITITGLGPSAQSAPATYSLALEEDEPGRLSTGSNVPLEVRTGTGTLGPISAPRMDVGLAIHLSFRTRGSGVVLTGSIEFSTPDAPTTGGVVPIRRATVDAHVPLVPGTPAVLASGLDIASGRRFEVTVTAQRLGT